MKQHPKNNHLSDDADAAVEKLLYEHYRRTGKIIPQTPDEVARAEAEDQVSPTKLPERLRNPDLFGQAPCKTGSRPLRFPSVGANPAVENLARAAREGGTISPEVEARMERDRAEAEREADKEDGNSK